MKLKDLAVGAKLGVSDTLFFIADQSRADYPGTVVIADEPVANCCYDAAEPENPIEDRAKNGSNEYPLSNVHQWLNAYGQNWFVPAAPSDRPPENFIDPMMPPEFRDRMPKCITREDSGYLTSFPQNFLDAMMTVEVPYIHTEAEGRIQPARFETKVFLPSQTELGLDIDIHFPDGSRFQLMKDPRMKLCRGAYWSRTPGFRDKDDIVLPYHMRMDQTSGTARVMEGMLYKFYGNKVCCSVSGVRPVMVLNRETEISGPDGNGIYTLQE